MNAETISPGRAWNFNATRWSIQCKALGDRVDKGVPRQCTHARRSLITPSSARLTQCSHRSRRAAACDLRLLVGVTTCPFDIFVIPSQAYGGAICMNSCELCTLKTEAKPTKGTEGEKQQNSQLLYSKQTHAIWLHRSSMGDCRQTVVYGVAVEA